VEACIFQKVHSSFFRSISICFALRQIRAILDDGLHSVATQNVIQKFLQLRIDGLPWRAIEKYRGKSKSSPPPRP
jgi:hypothetical protein